MTPTQVKSLRFSLGLTQTQMAERLGLKDRSQVCQIEKGLRGTNGPVGELLRGLMKENDRPLALKSLINLSASYPPSACGVYFLCKGKEVVYVGQSHNIFGRTSTHREGDVFRNDRSREEKKDFDRWYWLPVVPERLKEVERRWIKRLNPFYNRSDMNKRRKAKIRHQTEPVEPGMINGSKMKSLRTKRGLSMTSAALKAGWGKWGVPRWSLIERGIRRVVKFRTVEEIAAALRCTTQELLANGEETPEKMGAKNLWNS